MRRLLIATLVATAALALAALAAYQYALQRLHRELLAALGPRASVAAVHLRWNEVELRELRVRAEPGWPAEDELRAARVSVQPDLRAALGGAWRVRAVRVEDAYLSILRTRQGDLRIVPALLQAPRPQGQPTGPASADAPAPVQIDTVDIGPAVVEFFDASVRRQPHRLRVEQLQVALKNLALPALQQPLQLNLQGVIKGPRQDGRLTVRGTLTPASRDARLSVALAGVDLVALQPYLLRVNEGGVRRGTLDLSCEATVQAQVLHAPGRMALAGLELSGGSGLMGTFAGVPRQAVLAAMSRDGRIELQFTLQGRLDDPQFSLNETFARRVAVGLAESLGVNLRGVVEGVGSAIKGLFGF